MSKTAVAIAALVHASAAFAQSTSTTMDMGGGMTHVNTMGPNGAMSSSNCMNMGGGMTSCQTMDMSQPQRIPPTPDMSRPQTNGTTLNLIGDLVARSRERSFQTKLVQMLTSGDCHGAATFAFASGRYDVGNEIRRSCPSNASAARSEAMTKDQFMAGQPAPTFDLSKPYTTGQFNPRDSQWLEDTTSIISEARNARAVNWTKLATAKSGAVFYYDRASIYRTNSDIWVLMMVDARTDAMAPYPRIYETLWVDCNERNMALMSRVAYPKSGKPYSDIRERLTFERKPDGSIMAMIIPQVCPAR